MISIELKIKCARKRIILMRRCIEKDLEFNLTETDVARLLNEPLCYYTGLPFEDNANSFEPLQRTFERIDNTKGYIKSNVVVVTHIANQLKSRTLEAKDSDYLTPKNLSQMFTKIYKHLEKQK